MALGYESAVINGQLVPVAPSQAFDPLTYGSVLSGPGFWPAGSQYNLPPLLPNQSANVGVQSFQADLSVNPQSSSVPTAGAMNANGSINWLHPTKSPVWWVLGLLALALFMLHKVHYGK
jgi:hypothetical protein